MKPCESAPGCWGFETIGRGICSLRTTAVDARVNYPLDLILLWRLIENDVGTNSNFLNT